jgi:hypothetical protein
MCAHGHGVWTSTNLPFVNAHTRLLQQLLDRLTDAVAHAHKRQTWPIGQTLEHRPDWPALLHSQMLGCAASLRKGSINPQHEFLKKTAQATKADCAVAPLKKTMRVYLAAKSLTS